MGDWRRGFDLARLRPITLAFRDAEEGRCAGAFARVNDAWVAARLDEGRLLGDGPAYVALDPVRRSRTWTGFGGVAVAELAAGSFLVDRVVGPATEVAALLADRPVSGLLAWLPDDAAAEAAERLGLVCAGSVVTSAGDVRGLWAAKLTGEVTPARLAKGLARLPVALDPGPLLAQVEAAEPTWAPHYSSYNRRRSWTAVSLRGFGDEGYIEKPAEMSRKWKGDHPGWETASCADTALRGRLGAVEAYLEALGRPAVERIRLMALAPGGGELARHADSTDHDAGLADGRLCRLHAPLVTNPLVSFTSWGLDGRPRRAHMAAGEVWLLDHAKPHAAVNLGNRRRVHLVIDAWVDDDLGALLDAAR